MKKFSNNKIVCETLKYRYKKAILESLMSFKRAGASAIVSYYADRISSFLNY